MSTQSSKMAQNGQNRHFGGLGRPKILYPMVKMMHYMFEVHENSYLNRSWGLKPILTEENRFFSFQAIFLYIFSQNPYKMEYRFAPER